MDGHKKEDTIFAESGPEKRKQRYALSSRHRILNYKNLIAHLMHQ